MKKAAALLAAVLGLAVLLAAGLVGVRLIRTYTPSNEPADIDEILGSREGYVAIYLNNELQEEQGIYYEGQTYVPVKWVNEKLNERFYWDSNENILVYTLPETIVYADENTQGTSGAPLLVNREDGVYLAAGLVANYTNIRVEAFDEGEHKRIFVDSQWEPVEKAQLKRKGSVRVRGGIKSPVITRLDRGAGVILVEAMDTWVKVRTEDGYLGYVEKKRLGDIYEETPVSSFQEPVYTSVSMDEPVCMAWHQVTRPEANDNFESMVEDANGLNVISPTWYALTDNEGNFTSLADKEYVDKAHERGIQVWALIDNFSDNVNTEILMAKTSTRRKLIDSLMAEVEEYGLDGLNLDFEGIKEEAGVHYVQFIRELSVACRNNGTVLSVDNYVPTEGTAFYNRKEQGIVADYVIIMGYDEHHGGGEAGSVASIGFVEDGIANTLKEVPKEKVNNAIPLYTRVWTEQEDGTTTSSALGIARAQEWLDENQVSLRWDEDTGQYYGELETDEGLKRIWMKQSRSISLKMALIKKYDLAGVACWKLGFEPAQLWEDIRLDQE